MWAELDYPTTYLDVLISLHILAGFVGAFILCPLAAFARKGSRLHRAAGRWFLIDVVVISASGTLTLLDPAFLEVYWANETELKGFGQIFQSAKLPNLFFLFIMVMFAYSAFSAVRLWARTGYGAAERITSGPVDWGLALAMGVFALIFLGVGIDDWLHHEAFAATFIVGPLVMLGFVCFDLYTFIWRPRVARFRWWVLHVVKIMYVWAGLLQAFWLRVRAHILPEEWWDFPPHLGTILWVALTAVACATYRPGLPRAAATN